MGLSFMMLLQYYGRKYGVVASLKGQSIKIYNNKNTIFTYICKIIIGVQIILIILPIITIIYLEQLIQQMME